MTEAILIVRDLKKAFGSFEAVKGISFSVLQGEIFSLLGPNGAGKTTTISILSTLIEPSGGDAEIAGISISRDPLAVKRMIGMVPQDLALYEALTARQNLLFWGRMYGMSGKSFQRRIDEVLEQVGLTERANHRVTTFSGGMKRRLNIAIGLLHTPRLVFMDEPTVGIDPQSRRGILNMVKDLHDQGMTVIYTTHYMEEASELSDRIGIIDNGCLIALGTQKELTRMVGEQEILRLHLDENANVERIAPLFATVPGVKLATPSPGVLTLVVDKAEETLPEAMIAAQRGNVRIRSIDIEEPNLESVFLHLTGRALRD